MNCGRRLEETNGVFPLERCWTRGSTKRRRELEFFSLCLLLEKVKKSMVGVIVWPATKGENGLTMGFCFSGLYMSSCM
jgi:hypothetical protein